MSCTNDDSYDVSSHGASAAPSSEPLRSSTTTPSTGSEKLKKILPNPRSLLQPKKFSSSGSTVAVKGPVSSTLAPNKVMLLKQSVLKSSPSILSPGGATEAGDKTVAGAAPSKKKVVRPAAWLLHSLGLRMVRERVYDDLIEIQEEKESEGELTTNEQRQLGRLRGAYADLVKQNRPFTVRNRRHCRCGFSAGSRLELELHRDYGSISGDDFRYSYSCCLCDLRNIRSPVILSAHIERSHDRRSRVHTLPPTGFCPFCPYEQRTITKCKLSRHVINCALTYRTDRNLAPTAADADIPLFEVANPPASSLQSSASDVVGLKTSSTAVASKTPVSSSAAALGNVCSTVSAAGPVMTPAESQIVTSTPTGKTHLAKLARLAPLPDGLGFEICELCGAFLAGRDSMLLHMTQAHKLEIPDVCRRAEKPVVPCDKCTERFWTSLGLVVHRSQMHGEKTEPASPPTTICPLCKRTRLTDVVEHLARHHRITLVDMFAQRYCSVCQLTLHAARPFEHHMLTRHSDLFPDRAALYAAIVLVDRATRGRVGMVARGRQLSVLSGATGKPSSESARPASLCLVCFCEFADDKQVQEHVRQIHGFVCPHCGRKCSSSEFLRHHVETAHAADVESCKLCDGEVAILSMTDHLQNAHTESCSVSLTRIKDDLTGHVESLERKRRRGSTSSDSIDSSVDNDDCSEVLEEACPPAKKLKTL